MQSTGLLEEAYLLPNTAIFHQESQLEINVKVHLTLKIFPPSNKSCYYLEHFVTKRF